MGATHMGTGFDAWYPGYVDYAPVFKNIPGVVISANRRVEAFDKVKAQGKHKHKHNHKKKKNKKSEK